MYGKGSGCAAGTRQPVVRLAAFATAMEVCDPELGAHAARVAANAEAVAVRLGWTRRQLEALFDGFLARAKCKDEALEDCKVRRGCALGNAAVEIPEDDENLHAIVLAYKSELRRRLRKLSKDAGASEPDALSFLQSHLGGDRGITRAEVAKLALYMADRPGVPATLADVTAMVGDSSALEVEDALLACLLGRRGELDHALARLLAEGEAPVRLIRTAAGTLTRLLRLGVVAAAGGSIEAAIAAARPPIFFRLQKPFADALRRWSPEALAQGLSLLQAAELRCKSAAAPDALLCQAVFAQLAQLPARRQLPADAAQKRR